MRRSIPFIRKEAGHLRVQKPLCDVTIMPQAVHHLPQFWGVSDLQRDAVWFSWTDDVEKSKRSKINAVNSSIHKNHPGGFK